MTKVEAGSAKKIAKAGAQKDPPAPPPELPSIFDHPRQLFTDIAKVPNLSAVEEADREVPVIIQQTSAVQDLVKTDTFTSKDVQFCKFYPLNTEFKNSGRVAAPMKPDDLRPDAVKALEALVPASWGLAATAATQVVGEEFTDADIKQFTDAAIVRQYAIAGDKKSLAYVEHQGLPQLRYQYAGHRKFVAAQWTHVRDSLAAAGQPATSATYLADKFSTLSAEQVKTMGAAGLPVYIGEQAVHTAAYIPPGYVICEAALNTQPVHGLRLSLIAPTAIADYADYCTFLVETSGANHESAKQMVSLTKLMKKVEV